MTSNDVCNHEEELGVGEDDMRSIRTIIPHELERVEEGDEDQIEKQEQQLEEEKNEWKTIRAELGRLRTSEPMGLGMTHLSDDKNQWLNSPKPPSVINELFKRLTTLSSKLELAIELLSLF